MPMVPRTAPGSQRDRAGFSVFSSCFLLLLAVAVGFWISRRSESTAVIPAGYGALKGYNIPAEPLPVSYVEDPSRNGYTRLLSTTAAKGLPDTTAIVLNWSRFPNVVLIASLLCSAWLEHTISEVFIWNNSPNKIEFKDFAASGCSSDKLKIYNSPSNLLFQARFIACAEAKTPYCFTQDDDYLIRPEIIETLHKTFLELEEPSSIHLLPPHEHLSSRLRKIHSSDGKLHTTFAWLGHGTLFPRSKAVEFIGLMRHLNFTDEEMTMADNYFAVLNNQVPHVWFDQGIELGGGQPFTAGSAGDLRNRRHITRATQYLDYLLNCDAPPCLVHSPEGTEIPYVAVKDLGSATAISRAPCLGLPCLLKTNIRLLPESMAHTSDVAEYMLSIEEHNAELLGESGKRHYMDYPPSHAVDGRPDTAFWSPEHAREGDFVTLDLLAAVAQESGSVEMAWLVSAASESILRSCTFECSADGLTWIRTSHQLLCTDTSVEVRHADRNDHLRECSMQMYAAGAYPDSGARFFRARLAKEMNERWMIYEVWVRGLSRHQNVGSGSE